MTTTAPHHIGGPECGKPVPTSPYGTPRRRFIATTHSRSVAHLYTINEAGDLVYQGEVTSP